MEFEFEDSIRLDRSDDHGGDGEWTGGLAGLAFAISREAGPEGMTTHVSIVRVGADWTWRSQGPRADDRGAFAARL